MRHPAHYDAGRPGRRATARHQVRAEYAACDSAHLDHAAAIWANLVLSRQAGLHRLRDVTSVGALRSPTACEPPDTCRCAITKGLCGCLHVYKPGLPEQPPQLPPEEWVNPGVQPDLLADVVGATEELDLGTRQDEPAVLHRCHSPGCRTAAAPAKASASNLAGSTPDSSTECASTASKVRSRKGNCVASAATWSSRPSEPCRGCRRQWRP